MPLTLSVKFEGKKTSPNFCKLKSLSVKFEQKKPQTQPKYCLKRHLNVDISKRVPQPQDLQNRIFYDLVMIRRWYLGWGDFRAWQRFSKFLVNRCWLIFDIWCLIRQNRPKKCQKGNCWLKSRGVSVISCLQPWYLGEKWPKGYRTT